MTVGGRLLILIKDNIDFKPLSVINRHSIKIHCELWVIQLKSTNLIIVSVYHSPNGDFDSFLSNL